MPAPSGTPRGGKGARRRDLGSIPPHLLPDRAEVSGLGGGGGVQQAMPQAQGPHTPTGRGRRSRGAAAAAAAATAEATRRWKSPQRPQQHAWADPTFHSQGVSIVSRSPSPLDRSTANEHVLRSASQKQCPYGWHAKSPPRQVEVVNQPVAVPVRSEEQDSELALMKQQLTMSLAQVRNLRDENKMLRVYPVSPRKPGQQPGDTPLNMNQPLNKFLSSIDDIIEHHERIATAAVGVVPSDGGAPKPSAQGIVSPSRMPPGSPVPATAGDGAAPELKLLRHQLEQANATIAEQGGRIKDLEMRLVQREEHIDTLTRSLIDLGQHSTKLQHQVREIVNDHPRADGAPLVDPSLLVSPNRMMQGIEQQQAIVKKLDEEVIERFESKLSKKVSDASEDMRAVLSAIEEHKQRADQIVDLNKQSMGMLRSYYLDEGAAPPPEELPPASPPPPASTGAAEALASGEWVKRFDEALQRTYYYNESKNRVSWNLDEDLAKAGGEHLSPAQSRGARAPPPSIHAQPPMSPPLPVAHASQISQQSHVAHSSVHASQLSHIAMPVDHPM